MRSIFQIPEEFQSTIINKHCVKKFGKINQFFDTLTEYITTLKDRNGISIINCKRKAGFLCMLVSVKSLLCMYKTFV